jgi:hypothetical protein
MRFMMLMIPGGYEKAGPDAVKELDPEAVEKMTSYNRELEEAGVLRDLNGLHPPSSGVRVSFAGGQHVTRHGRPVRRGEGGRGRLLDHRAVGRGRVGPAASG